MAAQVLLPDGTYAPTPTTRFPLNEISTFNPDGQTNYPYEIYLPNEKEPANYRIHTNYTKNTDACASCHATHTAVGPSLLQWSSLFDTCMACHDGTVSTTYDVQSGKIAETTEPTYGGRFMGLWFEGTNYSIHGINSGMQIGSAPGGSNVGEIIAQGSESYTMWQGEDFGCESCHSPHGQGGNARILHPDPNGWASKQAQKIDHLYTVDKISVPEIAYVKNTSNKVTLIQGFPYEIIVQNIYNNTVYDITYKFEIDNNGDKINGSYTIIKAKPEYPDALSQITNVYGTAAVTVRMVIYNYLGPNETVLHLSGINTFCGTCHVDYNTEDEVLSGNGPDVIMGSEENRPGNGNPNGEYSNAHRHAVGLAWNYGDQADQSYIGPDKIMKTMGTNEADQKISCLTCHFAHGTDSEMWANWVSKYNARPDTEGLFNYWLEYVNVETGEYDRLQELSGTGSDLKRLPNMSTCEACHQKASANEGYGPNSGQVIPDP